MGVMIHPLEVISARKYGEVRLCVVTVHTGNLDKVLSKCGLMPESILLVEHDRKAAHEILSILLHKDMAHGIHCMSESEARAMAERVISCHETSSSRYYSNGNLAKEKAWTPFTDATFDAGLVISGQDYSYFCIWIEDED